MSGRIKQAKFRLPGRKETPQKGAQNEQAYQEMGPERFTHVDAS
jgi:hypothetical protein